MTWVFVSHKTEHAQQDTDVGGPEKFYVQQELNFEQLSKLWGYGKYAHKIKFYLKKINFILIHQTFNNLTQLISQWERKYS